MAKPLRIASLISSATEILNGLGLDQETVAIGHECDYPPSWSHKPRLTVSHVDSSLPSAEIDVQVQELMQSNSALYSVDRKLLAELRPDLLITQDQCDVCAVRLDDVLDILQSTPELRATQVLATNPNSMDDVWLDIMRIGKSTGTESRAATWIDQLRRRVNCVRGITDELDVSHRRRTICIEWTKPPMLAANWTPELIEWAGGINGPTVGGKHSEYCDWQRVIEFDPEVIVVAPCGFDLQRAIVEAETLFTLPNWTQLDAVSSGRVFAMDGNAYLNRSGPRLVDTLEILASLIQPEHFSPIHQRAVQSIA